MVLEDIVTGTATEITCIYLAHTFLFLVVRDLVTGYTSILRSGAALGKRNWLVNNLGLFRLHYAYFIPVTGRRFILHKNRWPL